MNAYPSSWDDIGFVNLAGGDYHLAPTSTYKGKGTDGTDPGVNPDLLPGGSPAPPPSMITTKISIQVPAQIQVGDHSKTADIAVTAADGSVPTGKVTLSFGPFGTFQHDLIGGKTSYTLYSLPAGTYSLQAKYLGDGNYAASQAGPVSLEVSAVPPPPGTQTQITITIAGATIKPEQVSIAVK
jgi:hypothetical protein